MGDRWWKLVILVGAAEFVGEAISAISDPGIVVFALVALAGTVLAYRGRLAGVVLIGVLSLLEVAFLPFYEHDTTTDVILQVVFGLLGAVGLVASAALLASRTRSA